MRVGMAMLSTTGGSSIVATNLAAALRERGIGVSLLHCGDRAATAGEELTALSMEASLHLQRSLDVDRAFCGAVDLCSQMLDWYRRAPFDLLHLHNVHVFGLAALMLKRVHGVPFVVTFHGSDVLDERTMQRSSQVVRAVLAEAGGVSCVSRYLAMALARATALESRVIFNFLDDDFVRRPLRTAAAAPRILHVSSLREVKRPELLLASFAAFLEREPGATLRIATTRQGARRAAELGMAHQLGRAVTVIDTEEHPEQLHDEYREAAALLLTSRYESFGLVLLEALAYGAPVVAPALGGIPEVLGADWPFLVEQSDHPAAYAARLAEALAPAARRQVQAAAPALLRRFSSAAAFDGYAQLYRDALHAQAKAQPPTQPGAM